MFEVLFKSSEGNFERHVVHRWWIAQATAKRAVQDGGIGVRIKRIRTDVWLVDENGAIYEVSQRTDAGRAAKWAREFAGVDREFGVLLWPSERREPKRIRN